MNPGMITALAAVSGSLVGALGSAVGTWITQRHEDRRDLLGQTAEQIQSQAMNGQDPLRKFSDTCRAELDSLQRQL